MTGYLPNIQFKSATSDDVTFVAECVLAAIDRYDFHTVPSCLRITENICSRDDTIYSYRNAIIATVDDTPIGCLLAYDGAIYSRAREITYELFAKEGASFINSEIETCPGEWYLDSLAILPSFRGYGLGKLMLEQSIRHARKHGFKSATLIVEDSKPALHDYYKSLGFEDLQSLHAFGSEYTKMIKML